MRWTVAVLFGLLASGVGGAAEQASVESSAHRTRTVRGRVVWLSEAMARLHGVELVGEADERTLVLETSGGELHPLVENERGRAFRRDARLRGIDVELVARQHRGSPFLQIMKVLSLEGPRRYVLDYWCEICSIAMIELKPCDCCQGSIELRRREVDGDGRVVR